MSTIAENIAKVAARIRAAAQASGRDPAQVQLLAVSKTKPAQAVAEAARVLRRGSRLLLSSLARHEHRSVVEAYGHVNLGFSEKELRKFAEKAGLEIANAETVTRERRPPHFEVLSLTAVKP